MVSYKLIISLSFLLLSNIFTIGQNISADSITVETRVQPPTGSDVYDSPDTVLYFNQKNISADSITEYKNAKAFAYAKKLDSLLKSMQQKEADNVQYKPRKKSWLERFFGSSITKYLFWGFAVAFILIILYKLFFAKGFFQKQSVRALITELPEEDELSINADYANLIAGAVADKNYRLAVRYLYLQSLQKLSASGAIIFAADKTNYEYVKEVASKPYKNNFAAVTLHYEYVWYGEFEIDELIFLKLQSEFKQFYNQL